MKRTLILLLFLVGLGVIYLLSTNHSKANTSIKLADRSFMEVSSKDIHTITIDAPSRPMIHLSRKENDWYVNLKNKVSKNVIGNILSALDRMEIQYVPSKAESNTAKMRMEKFGLDVKTYDEEGNLLSDFMLGTNTNNEYGTYVLNEGADQAYVMHMTSHEGGLRGFFTHDIKDFRDLGLLDLDAEQISALSIDYPKDVENSFLITNQRGNYKWGDDNASGMSQKIADAFFKGFQNLNAEQLLNHFVHKDEIIKKIPFVKINLALNDGTETWMNVYPEVDVIGGYNTKGIKDLTTRHESYFVHASWGDFYKVQDRFLRQYFVTPSHFEP